MDISEMTHGHLEGDAAAGSNAAGTNSSVTAGSRAAAARRFVRSTLNTFHGSARALRWDVCYAGGMPKALINALTLRS